MQIPQWINHLHIDVLLKKIACPTGLGRAQSLTTNCQLPTAPRPINEPNVFPLGALAMREAEGGRGMLTRAENCKRLTANCKLPPTPNNKPFHIRVCFCNTSINFGNMLRMKNIYFPALFLLSAFAAQAKTDSSGHSFTGHTAYTRYTTIASLSVGFVDGYRNGYTMPAGFRKQNTSGIAPFYAKLEYGLYNHISIAAIFAYDAFQYNFQQEYSNYNGPFTRYRTNKVRIVSGGVAAYYHLDKYIRIARLDPFIGVGLSLNNIRYSALPQGDSTLTQIEHTITPYLKVGARYYISDQFSLFADVGYDRQSIASIGFSCRFFSRRK
jgi:hypothetical protein